MIFLCQNDSDIERACETAANTKTDGKIIAYPTESTYALGCRFDDLRAIEQIYQIKNRPIVKIFPLIIGDIESLNMVVSQINDVEKSLMDRYWAGALTILFDAKSTVPPSIVGENNKIAVRMSGHKIAKSLAQKMGCPIIATSANPSGFKPAVNVSEILEYFDDKIDVIIDGGQCLGGQPSTIIEVVNGSVKIIRHGAIAREDIANNGFNVLY